MKCPLCGAAELDNVIYMGLPMRLCSGDTCNYLTGFWSFVVRIHFNGTFMQYEGSYWRALWHWLFYISVGS